MRFKIPADVDFLAVNHASWDKLAQLHYDDPNDWYDIKGFLAGKDARCVIDQREMGDLSGARVLHSQCHFCLLYTSPSPRDGLLSRMPSSA